MTRLKIRGDKGKGDVEHGSHVLLSHRGSQQKCKSVLLSEDPMARYAERVG